MSEPTLSAALARLVSEHELTTRAATRLALLLDLVAREPSAITSVRDPNEALDVHVADSLTGLELDVVRAATRIADLGSGAGFPGLVLAIALPRARVSLVDSVERKVAFLRSAVTALALENAHVVHARAEAWPEGIARHDLVTARALAPLAVLLEYASPLLAPGGALVAWKGRRDPSEEADGRAASAILGMSPPRPHELAARSRARHRTLYASAKVASTPNRFPRRPGMARKHPLRAAEGGEESSVAKL